MVPLQNVWVPGAWIVSMDLRSGSTKGGRPFRLPRHIAPIRVRVDATVKTEGAHVTEIQEYLFIQQEDG